MSYDRRSIERELKYVNDVVCGITWHGIREETLRLAEQDGFLPTHLGKIEKSSLFRVLIDFTAFAAMNLLRKRNGLEPLTEIAPLVQLAEVLEDE